MTLDLETVSTFVKVAELGSFTRAGQQLGLSKSRVSLRVQALERELGTRLLQRSTRVVRLTPDGEQLLARGRRLLLDADQLSSMFQAARALRGRLRVDLPVGFARDLIIPRLPEFLAAHPQLDILASVTDRRVDVVREGFDCVLRVGALADSGLTARRLGTVRMVNLASPAYLAAHGTPRTPDDLDHHLIVHYASDLGADPPTFEYRDGDGYRERPVRSVVTVNSSDAYLAACLAGLGIIQTPRAGKQAGLAAGALVEVLPAHTCAPMPVSIVHAHGRSVPRRVAAFMGWLADLMRPHLDA
jgi:DNA-binding transcriptional LysR family regulator